MTTARITASKIKPAGANLTAREQQVLDAAAKLAKPGEPVSPSAIAAKLGVGRNYVGTVTAKLKARGLWKHASSPRGRKAGGTAKAKQIAVATPVATPVPANREADVIDTLKGVADLLRPLSEADRRRVLECATALLLPKA